MLTTYDIARVLSMYDLGKLFSVTQAQRGFVNETAFIQTSRGRFVVRRNHRRLGQADQRYRHRLTAWLNDHHFRAPALVSARDGSTLITLDGRFYEIRVFVEGEDFDPTRPQQLVSVGQALARYHQAIKGFPPFEVTQPRYNPQTILGMIERLLERDTMGDLHEPLAWYDKRAAVLRPLMAESRYKTLPHLVIHGDIHSDNFLFAGDEVVALIDYDQATWDARIVDVADALIGFATTGGLPGQLTWGVFQGPLGEEQAARLLSGYTSVTPLSAAELVALPVMIELVWLQSELGRVISTPEGAPEYHRDVLEQGRWLSNWMREHSERLTTRWMKLETEVIATTHALAA